jgi:hypothetical protein
MQRALRHIISSGRRTPLSYSRGFSAVAMRDISSDLLISSAMGHGVDAKSNEGLVNNLVKMGLIRSESCRVAMAMSKVDRAHFSPQ